MMPRPVILRLMTLRPVMRMFKLDRLSPLNKALRSKVLTLVLAEVRGAVAQTSRDFELAPAITESVVTNLTTRREADGLDPEPLMISDPDRITVGLVALTNRERRIVLGHHAQQSVSSAAIERLLRQTDLLIDAAKTDGAAGYARGAAALLAFSFTFRFAHFLHLQQPVLFRA